MHQYKQLGLPPGPNKGNPDRRKVLRDNRAMRDGIAPAPRSLDFGRVEMRIPELDYYVLLERFPDLQSPDAEIKRKAWQQLARSELGEVYRVSRRGK